MAKSKNFTPSPPRMIENEEVRLKIEKKVDEVLNKRIEHEMERLLSKYGG